MRKQGLPKIIDYSKLLLLRVFAGFLVLIIALIPLVKYFMEVFEGKEITLGQAAVFVVQSITTTGYGELLPFHSYPMKVISILLMLSGVLMIFIIAGTLIATLIERRVAPRAPIYTNLRGHVVFTGFNETVARTITMLEKNNVSYVVAAREQPAAVELIEKGINCVCANPRYEEGLRNLGLDNAQLVVACNDDPENISIILGISALSDTPVLAVMENEKRAELASNAGAAHVVALEETVGRQLVDWICADASPTEFLNLIDVELSPEIMEQLKPSIIHVGAFSELKGKSLGELQIRRRTGATVAAIWHSDGTITSPSAETVIDESTLIVLGPHDNVDRLASYAGGPGPGEHVVIVGAGRVGQQAGKRLNQAGITPFIIDSEEKYLYFDGSLVVGDATMAYTLKNAEIREADTLIVTLNNDSHNIFTVLNGRQLNPDLNIVARAVHVDSAERLRQAGANHVLSEAILGAQLLQVAMVEMGVLPKFCNYVIREITWEREAIEIRKITEVYKRDIKIICVVSDGEVMKPTADYVVEKGDLLVALAPKENMAYFSGVVFGESL